MSVAAFDTLKLARTLRDQAKFTPEQAEGLAEALSGAFRDDIATKADLRELELRLTAKIDGVRADAKAEAAERRSEVKAETADLRSELKADIADLRSDLNVVTGGLRTDIQGIRGEIQLAKNDMLRWVVPLFLAQMAVMIGVLIRVF